MKITVYISFVLCVCLSTSLNANAETKKVAAGPGSPLVLTIATENSSDAFKRFARAVEVNGLPFKVLGLGEQSIGGGRKLALLKEELEKHKDDSEKIIVFTNTYNTLFNGEDAKIGQRFRDFKADILFSADKSCWPDAKLLSQYPEVEGSRFLNSGLLVAYAPALYKLLQTSELADDADEQLFFTKVYLDDQKREKFNIKVDHSSDLLQTLDGDQEEVELRFAGKESHVQNAIHKSVPLVIRADGSPQSNLLLNTIGNYIPKGWNEDDGCLLCLEDTIDLSKKQVSDYPAVLIGMFFPSPTPFTEEFFKAFLALDYPKKNIHLFIHVGAEYHVKHVDEFIKAHGKEYQSVKLIRNEDNVKDWHARNLAIEESLKKKCEYYFSLDSVAHLDNPQTLKLLIEQNRPILAPMMLRPDTKWSNFWGSISDTGYYARSIDYMEIVDGNRRGMWNVPLVNSVYLVRGDVIRNYKTKPWYIHKLLDADMAFASNMRNVGVYLYVTNLYDFGHLINADNFETTHLNNELYEIKNNRLDWEKRYLHVNFSQNLDPDIPVAMPCPDVFWFPAVTERFADELVGEMENLGKWSDGTSHDPRIAGGYEAVPTRDIHLKQVGLEEAWLHFLQFYVQPLQKRVYEGYHHDPPRAIMNFVVRYRPEEQPSLRPHQDSSTYTVNMALNHAGIDFEGGGCRFVRYDCAVVDTRKGWLLMNPGRLTHQHEGLTTTKGTRYIMVSFVDP